MIRNWSIRNRVLLLALLPVISLGVVLGGYFIHSRVHDLKSSQSALGHALVSQLASAAEYGLLTHNPQVLQRLARNAIRERNVESVTIADGIGHILAQAIQSTPQKPGFISDVARRIGAETGFEGELVFTRPITLQSISAGELSALSGNQDQRVQPQAGAARVLGKVTVTLSEVQFAESQAQIIVNGGLIVLACLAFGILLALAISGSVVAPIGRIIAMVGRFSSGDHAARVPANSGGELGRLEQQINHMAANAQRSQQELQEQVDQATAELRGTLEEMEIKSVELDLARKRAVEASRIKSEFLANMSHEIRTPMNAVLGFSDLLTRTPLNEGQQNYLTTLRQSAHALLALLDNVLNAARLETSEPGIQMHPFVLHDLLEEIVQISAMEAYTKQLELVLHIQGDTSRPLLGDRIKLTRAISNLVTNAIKFTDTGSVIIRSHTEPQRSGKVHVNIRVIDTGIGIRDQDRRRLFEPFFQVNGSADRQHGGAGLGLYITKKLIEQLGGSLTLTSALGHGSEFCLSLVFPTDDSASLPSPVSGMSGGKRKSLLVYESQAQAADALLARLERLGWNMHLVTGLSQLPEFLQTRNLRDTYAAVLFSLSYTDLREPAQLDSLLTGAAMGFPCMALVNSVNAEIQADISRRIGGPCLPKSVSETTLGEHLDRMLSGAPAALPADARVNAPVLRGLNIIVADDNRINRLLARILLEKCGATVLEAKTGQEVIDLEARHPVDLILLDMHMPGEDGWQVAKRLKSGSSAHRDTPIIALSAIRNEKSAQTLDEAGLAGWLTKPLEADTLRDAVLKHLRPMDAARYQAGPVALRDSADLETAIADLRPSIRQMLTEDLPVQWQAIETAWRDQNFPQLGEQLHKLNGSAAFCRLASLHDACDRLENSLRHAKSEDLARSMALLGREIQETLVKLDVYTVRPAAGA
ncbi:MAG: ATP-binding protein [Gammaproteobacteria bacterium]